MYSSRLKRYENAINIIPRIIHIGKGKRIKRKWHKTLEAYRGLIVKNSEGDEDVTHWKHMIRLSARNVVTIQCVIAKFGATVSKPCDDGDVVTLARPVDIRCMIQ